MLFLARGKNLLMCPVPNIMKISQIASTGAFLFIHSNSGSKDQADRACVLCVLIWKCQQLAGSKSNIRVQVKHSLRSGAMLLPFVLNILQLEQGHCSWRTKRIQVVVGVGVGGGFLFMHLLFKNQ